MSNIVAILRRRRRSGSGAAPETTDAILTEASDDLQTESSLSLRVEQ